MYYEHYYNLKLLKLLLHDVFLMRKWHEKVTNGALGTTLVVFLHDNDSLRFRNTIVKFNNMTVDIIQQ